MKVLVTGASGNVGQYVVRELIAIKQEVVAGGTDVKRVLTSFMKLPVGKHGNLSILLGNMLETIDARRTEKELLDLHKVLSIFEK